MQPNVTFMTQKQIEDEMQNDNTVVVEHDLGAMERSAVIECANHPDVTHVTICGRDWEGFLVIKFDSDRDDMPYNYCYVTTSGRVAEAMINQPVYHRNFREMVEDTRAARALKTS